MSYKDPAPHRPTDVVMPTPEELRKLEQGEDLYPDAQSGQAQAANGSRVKNTVLGILGAAAGWATAEYFRVSLILIPGVAFIASVAVLSKILGKPQLRFLYAISLQASHLVWMTIAAIALHQPLALVECLCVAFGLGLLVWKPGWRASIPLGVYNISLLAWNILQLGVGLPPEVGPKAIQLHILIRVAILVSLAFGCSLMDSREEGEEEEPDLHAPGIDTQHRA